VIHLDGTEDDDVLMISHLVNVDETDIEIGMPVSVNWAEMNDEITLPLFEPV
jgi:uncharacterized OB-fold protein